VLLCGNARSNGNDRPREKRGANSTFKTRRDKALFISYTFHYFSKLRGTLSLLIGIFATNMALGVRLL